MQVLLTFDYELFFGTETGSVRKCMIEPTNELLSLCRKYGIGMTFFVDVGFLLQLEAYADRYPKLENDLGQIKAQIGDMLEAGCSVQLHIHPHWEKSSWDGEKWQVVTDGCYKLDDFPDDEITRIVRSYHAYLAQLTGKPVQSFRAGGWCIQPFSRLRNVFAELGITIDSSVFPGGKFQSPHYNFDFTCVEPYAPAYRFEDDVCVPVSDGTFTEYPIASWKYSPWFYWKLYGWGRVRRSRHRMMGDGRFLAQPGRKQSVLTSSTWNHVSADGYYAGMLTRQARAYDRKGVEHFVVIGHPKGLTVYALGELEWFIDRQYTIFDFTTFSDLV
jgi:peptidoglycan/xylan/chitin deacetylase (PgdA/CDA1 family)